MYQVRQWRKANWMSRKAHSALIIMKEASLETGEPVTIPKLLQRCTSEVSYVVLSQGLAELTKLGLVRREDVSLRYDNGLRPRTFSGAVLLINDQERDYLIEQMNNLYSKFSVEQVAAITTIAYLNENVKDIEKCKRYFQKSQYLMCLREPNQLSKHVRSFADAGKFVEGDKYSKYFIVTDHDPATLEMFNTLDKSIQGMKKWKVV